MINKANLQIYRRQLLEQLDHVDAMLENFNKLAGVPQDTFEPLPLSAAASLRSVPNVAHTQQPYAAPTVRKQARVRGVLAAVKEIVNNLPGPFDKNEVIAKLREKDPDFAAHVSTANLRNTLRLLARNGDIKVLIDATSKTCAKYVSKRAAA